MSGFYKKAVVWLGLNEEYSDAAGGYDVLDEADDSRTESDLEVGHHEEVPSPGPSAEGVHTARSDSAVADARPAHRAEQDREAMTVRPIPLNDEAPSDTSDAGSGTVRVVPMSKSAVPETVIPASYNNAQDVADVYKDGKPVVVNLESAERDLSRRLIDFSAGLCYGLGGGMEKLKNDVYLLVPDGVEVSAEDKDRLR